MMLRIRSSRSVSVSGRRESSQMLHLGFAITKFTHYHNAVAALSDLLRRPWRRCMAAGDSDEKHPYEKDSHEWSKF